MEFKKHYLKYEEYRFLGGTLDETPFNIFELEAQKIIDKYTSGRLRNIEEQINEVKVCAYRLIDELQGYHKNATVDKNISSENIDGYSVSYGGLNSEILKAKENELRNIVRNELAECYFEDGTPYTYTGVDR